MIRFTTGNLLEADVEALVNTVNTVGVMGKGVALMFKEAYPENYRAYAAACKAGEVEVGRMFVTERRELIGPHWIINFPTKQHWRGKTQLAWIDAGLEDLQRVIAELGIRSLALPPLGCGNGGLDWNDVRPRIEAALACLDGVEVTVFEPTQAYQNVQKRHGVEKLTPARALVAELVRRYGVLGFECSILELQKLAWFLENNLREMSPSGSNPLDLRYEANRYGPYAHRLTHLLDAMDGSYLYCDKRLPDAGPFDVIEFDQRKRDKVDAYLRTGEGLRFLPALERTSELIDGFQSPLGLEVLATVDWLLRREGCAPTLESIKSGLARWPGDAAAAKRKLELFDDRMLQIALDRLVESGYQEGSPAKGEYRRTM